MPRAIILLNPRSRSGAHASVDRLLAPFTAAGWEAEIWAGSSPEWTTAAAARARDLGVDAIFGAGGDGMLARMLPALVNSDVALGVIPLGTGNVWARELGLPMRFDRAIQHQLASMPRAVDVGRANGRLFLVIASAGIDARIVEMIESDPASKRLGQLAYPLAGLSLTAGVRGAQASAWLDDDPRVLVGLHHTDPTVVMRRVRRLRIETVEVPLPVETDGDSLGSRPLQVDVLPGVLLALG